MIRKIVKLLKKHDEVFRYLVVGGVNTILFFILYTWLVEIIGIHYLMVNSVLWIISVIFVFFANKYIVFKSSNNRKLAHEVITFFCLRFVSSGIDMFLLWVQIDKLGLNKIFAKVVCTIIVIVVNWICSKLIVFNNNNKEE